LNTGISFTAPVTWLGEFGVDTPWKDESGLNKGGWTDNKVMPRQIVDVNGDGLPDIVGFHKTGVKVALNTGTSFKASTSALNDFGTDQQWVDSSFNPRYIVDSNYDGLPDIWGFGLDGVKISTNLNTTLPDLLSTVTPKLGSSYTVSYLPLTNSNIYTKAAYATTSDIDVIFPVFVVSNVKTSDGLNGFNQTDYLYNGLVSNLERGLQGFKATTVINRATNMRINTEFNVSFPQAGMMANQTTGYCGVTSTKCFSEPAQSGASQDLIVISKVVNTLDSITKDGSSNKSGTTTKQKIYFPYIKSSTSTTYEPPR
jgi:hypothetical protein